MSAFDLKKPILRIHKSTIPTLSEIERLYLDRFVTDGRAVILEDEPVIS